MVPSFLTFSVVVLSSVSSRTRFRCWSNPLSRPRKLFPPFSLTRTILLRFCSRISVVISLIFWAPLEEVYVFIVMILLLNLSKWLTVSNLRFLRFEKALASCEATSTSQEPRKSPGSVSKSIGLWYSKLRLKELAVLFCVAYVILCII